MRLVPGPEHAGVRLDRFVTSCAEDASRSLVAEWIRGGRARVNGAVERRPSRKLRGGERIDVERASRPPLKAVPEPIPISVLHEDGQLAIVNKPAGMNVHAGAGHRTGTLVNALLHHFESLSTAAGEQRPGIVHRLDRFTTGVMVVAKSNLAHRRLQRQFEQRRVRKLYWAAVHGGFPRDPRAERRLLRHGCPVKRDGLWWLRVDLPIRRDRRNRVKMAAARKGREAVSDIRALRTGGRFAAVEVRIHTGRTHQVRVHLASAGHPVVGDSLYGAPRAAAEAAGVEHFLLHARALQFDHPLSGERMRFEAPLPAHFEAAAARLGL